MWRPPQQGGERDPGGFLVCVQGESKAGSAGGGDRVHALPPSVTGTLPTRARMSGSTTQAPYIPPARAHLGVVSDMAAQAPRPRRRRAAPMPHVAAGVSYW